MCSKIAEQTNLMNMDRAIFDIKVSVEATSLYILLCALMDGGQAPTLENARLKWTGTVESLLAAAQELVRRCVVTGTVPIPEDMHLHPNTRDRWCW
jgi:hypothetical protein